MEFFSTSYRPLHASLFPGLLPRAHGSAQASPRVCGCFTFPAWSLVTHAGCPLKTLHVRHRSASTLRVLLSLCILVHKLGPCAVAATTSNTLPRQHLYFPISWWLDFGLAVLSRCQAIPAGFCQSMRTTRRSGVFLVADKAPIIDRQRKYLRSSIPACLHFACVLMNAAASGDNLSLPRAGKSPPFPDKPHREDLTLTGLCWLLFPSLVGLWFRCI